MRFDTDSIIQTRNALHKGDIVPFETQEEMVTGVAEVLALGFQQNLEFWKATAMDDVTETCQWQQRLQSEPEPYYEAVRAELERQVKACERFPFYRKKQVKIGSRKYSDVIAAGLSAIGGDQSPSNVFPINVLIVLDVRKNQVQQHIYATPLDD